MYNHIISSYIHSYTSILQSNTKNKTVVVMSSAGGEEKAQASAQLQQFIAQEQAKAQLQQTISRLTDECWDKCVSSPGTYFTGRENACLDNCAKRFLDTTQFVIKYYQSKSKSSGGDGGATFDEFS